MKSRMRILAMAAVLAVAAGAAVPAAAQEWIEIGDAAALRGITNLTANYRLTADIDLGNKVFTPLGEFSGTFDGGGHTIRNLYIFEKEGSVGLFKGLNGATVRDLAIRGGSITGNVWQAGAIAGYVEDGGTNVIEGCTADLEIFVVNSSNGGYVGGLVGSVGKTTLTISRCQSLCALTSFNGYGNVRTGGLVGGATSTTLLIDGCHAGGSVQGTGSLGGLVGYRMWGTTTISGSYWTAELRNNFNSDTHTVGYGEENCTITDVPEIIDALPKNTFTVRRRGNGSGTAAFADGEFTAVPAAGSAFIRWEGLPPESGDYNERTVWAVFGRTVSSIAEMQAMDFGGFYVQTEDIDMSSVTGFNGLRFGGYGNTGFFGYYDGGNHEIRNMTITNGCGLFASGLLWAEIRNLRLVNPSVAYNNGSATGVLAGGADGGCVLSNVHVEGGSVTLTRDCPVGGLVGEVNVGVSGGGRGGLVEDCSSSARVEGASEAGGLLGGMGSNVTVIRCQATGDVAVSGDTAGGLVGNAGGGGIIATCRATGDVTAGEGNAGGLVGYGNKYGTAIQDSFATGSVRTGTGNAGGFAGYSYGNTYANCFSAGAVESGDADKAFGFAPGIYQDNFAGSCFDKDTSGIDTASGYGEVALTTAEMQSGEPFEGWSTEAWVFTEGLYPRLIAFIPLYTVRWLAEDGETPLEQKLVAEYDTPVYDGETPEKAEDTYNTYVFSGWTPEVVPAVADADYAATFETVPKWTGSGTLADPYVLLGPERIAEIIALDGGATAEMYVKTGGSVTEAALGAALPTGYAVRESGTAGVVKVVQVVTVVWYDEDGRTVLERDEDVAIGSTPSYDGAVPTKPATAQYTYEFAGWTPEPVEVTGSAAYTATYAATLRSYAITWRNADGSLLGTDTVAYGTVPEHAAPASVYNFLGWTPEVVAVAGEATYTATFGHQVVLDNLTADYTATDGDELVGSSSHTVTIPGGVTVTFNGTPVTGTGGGEPPAPVAPVFANGGASIATDFAAEGVGKWTVEAVGVLEAGTAEGVTPAMVKVYAADTVAGLSTATPLSTGVTLENRMNAVLVTLEVEPESTAEQQFFKVKFGD